MQNPFIGTSIFARIRNHGTTFEYGPISTSIYSASGSLADSAVGRAEGHWMVWFRFATKSKVLYVQDACSSFCVHQVKRAVCARRMQVVLCGSISSHSNDDSSVNASSFTIMFS